MKFTLGLFFESSEKQLVTNNISYGLPTSVMCLKEARKAQRDLNLKVRGLVPQFRRKSAPSALDYPGSSEHVYSIRLSSI